ncbi:hypothetical protein NDU88_012503 [Pleurodeles waltl]|uniref:Uncharacterized protein n=1 Tax=Pleurodeles waltl TaxID=8319 RepID=A0AAV7R642_PLEWA|nr:hypothetical protein NDU88_012503 [Pleurodeles waltl]
MQKGRAAHVVALNAATSMHLKPSWQPPPPCVNYTCEAYYTQKERLLAVKMNRACPSCAGTCASRAPRDFLPGFRPRASDTRALTRATCASDSTAIQAGEQGRFYSPLP